MIVLQAIIVFRDLVIELLKITFKCLIGERCLKESEKIFFLFLGKRLDVEKKPKAKTQMLLNC